MTKKEIEEAIEELRLAMLESLEASQAEDKAKQRKIKAHCRLSLAKEAVRSINQEVQSR